MVDILKTTKETYEKNPPTDEEILNRWIKLGMVNNKFDDDLKLGLAKAYEDMAKTLLLDETIDNVTHKWFEMIIFPIINRLVRSYYYKHNTIKEVAAKEYIEFFKNTSISNIIEKSYPIYDDKNWDGKPFTNEQYTEMNNKRQFVNDCFNKLFENFDKDMKLINLVYSNIHDELANIRKELLETDDIYKELSTLDIEAVFVTMICDVMFPTLFE